MNNEVTLIRGNKVLVITNTCGEIVVEIKNLRTSFLDRIKNAINSLINREDTPFFVMEDSKLYSLLEE